MMMISDIFFVVVKECITHDTFHLRRIETKNLFGKKNVEPTRE
jgi:hypothetical protein